MQNVKHAVIACAGYGSRLGLNFPKCMIKVNERTLLNYLLELTQDIEDVRVVVGFEEDAIIEEVRRVNANAIIIRNPDYRRTTIAYSYYLATRDLKEPFLIIDGDLAIDKKDFTTFLAAINPNTSLLGVTPAQSEDAYFATLDSAGNVTAISHSEKSEFEWSGIAYLAGVKIEENSEYLFNGIAKVLPIRSQTIRCFDVDTSEDMLKMMRAFDTLGYGEET